MPEPTACAGKPSCPRSVALLNKQAAATELAAPPPVEDEDEEEPHEEEHYPQDELGEFGELGGHPGAR